MNRTSLRLEVGQDRGEVAGLGQHRAGGGAEVHAQLAGDDLGQRGLAEARRAEQQHVVQRLAARPGGLDEHPQVALGLLLADELGQRLRAAAPCRALERRGLAGDQAGHRPSSCRAALISAGASASSPSRSAACSTTRRAAGSATPRPIRAATASPAADGLARLGGGRRWAWKAATGAVADRLVLQLGDDAQGELGADALGAGHGGLVARAATAAASSAGRQHVEHRQRRLGPDALDGLQHHEGAALVAVEEAVERHAGLLAPLGLDVQQRLVADRAAGAPSVREPQRTT